MSRFARQIQVIGPAAQERLSRSHILVVGAGGLGCPVLQYLAGAGVGRITLLDPDLVEESNLHRQPLYRMDDLGQPKAIAASAHLMAAHPALQIEAQVARLTPSNAPSLVAGVDLVVDAADSYAAAYILSDACFAAQTLLVAASVLGRKGYAGLFCGPAPSLRAVFPDLPDAGGTCATEGVLGPVVGMIGTLQAQLALAALSTPETAPFGRLVSLDMSDLSFGGFSFMGAPEPKQSLPFVDANSLSPEDLLIELRPESECLESFFPGAQRLLPEALANTELPHDKRIVLACRTGLRSWRAARGLMAKGHTNLALFAAETAG